jgi:hypothetical protein
MIVLQSIQNFVYITFRSKTCMSSISKPTKHNTIGWTFKLFKCDKTFSSVSSLSKSILENLQCFQEFLVLSIKKLRFRVNENQVNLKLK